MFKKATFTRNLLFKKNYVCYNLGILEKGWVFMSMAGLMNFLVPGTNISTDNISDQGLAAAMVKLGEIVGTLMTIIYIVLGLFLVVKGAILGMQIVKAADEPQVRQEKIASLKWLVIGIAIAYGVAGVVHIVIGVISSSTNLTSAA